MTTNSTGMYLNKQYKGRQSEVWRVQADSAIASSHLALHCIPSEFPTKKYGELTKKGQILDLKSGERSGNTTAPNRSTVTVISIRF